VLSFSIPKAGDYIDTSAATVTGDRANRVRLAKEDSFHFNGFYADKLQQVLTVYYDEMIQSLVQGIKQAFSSSRNLPKSGRPLPIVLSGGTALPEGFRERFEKILQEADVPIASTEIRMASDPLHASAKGALIAALADV
jgi:tRNA A37 threonylcarbamoyltransferase TsaD